MGLFDRKYCDICGEKIGLLGNRKLEDGNLCKNCAKKLSPWFSDRRNSTVAEIREQLSWREANLQRAAQFRATRSFGERTRLLLDETHRWFTVTRASNIAQDNPDILDFSAITGCSMDIDQHGTELKLESKDSEGKTVRRSYNPPRYEYDYFFNITVTVNLPYYCEMKFQFNDNPVHIPYRPTGTRWAVGSFAQMHSDEPLDDPSYRRYKETCEELCALMESIRSGAAAARQAPGGSTANGAPGCSAREAEVMAETLKYVSWSCPKCGRPVSGATVCPDCGAALSDETILSRARTIAQLTAEMENNAQSWSCPFCGTKNTGKFCESCGAGKPEATVQCSRCGWKPEATVQCSRCGWKPENADKAPKFCPECGQPM